MRVAESGETKQITKIKETCKGVVILDDETFKLLTELVEDISLDADTVGGVVSTEIPEESEEGVEESVGKRAKGKKRKKKGDEELG